VFLLLPLAVTLAATGVIEIASGVLLSVIVLLVARVMRPKEAYRSVDWSVLILIAAMVPVGGAIVSWISFESVLR
jgi:di/tricarboxylate transporter